MVIKSRSGSLAVLTVILSFNYIDRIALGILVQDIKLSLQLTDTEIGLLTGISFALFYSIMGIPLARWADRGDRVTLISLAVGLWSAAVAVCGIVTSFLQLMLVRVIVGVGEAAFEPASISLLADYYKRHERAWAIARFKLGWPIAIIIGNFAAGWLNEFVGWRLTFVILGSPGIVLAVIALAMAEPRRGARDSGVRDTQGQRVQKNAHAPPPLGEVLVHLWRNQTYRHLLFCILVATFFTIGIMQWQPTFYIRSHHFETGHLGTIIAIFYGGGVLLGTYVGGEFVYRFAATNERLQLLLTSGLFTAFGVLQAGVYLVAETYVSIALLTLSAILGGAINAPLFAVIQTIIPSSMRAMSLASILFLSNLVGAGLGPLLVGAISDSLHASFGSESLRFALAIMTPGFLWCSWFLWRASQSVSRDVAAAEGTTTRMGAASRSIDFTDQGEKR